MFKWTNPKIEILTLRVKDAEKLSEALIAENKRIEIELEKAQHQCSYLQEKLFNLAGINRQQSQQRIEVGQKPIEIGSGRGNWNQTKQTLELKAQEKYWIEKNKKVEESINQLENEIGIQSSNEVKAN